MGSIPALSEVLAKDLNSEARVANVQVGLGDLQDLGLISRLERSLPPKETAASKGRYLATHLQ